jgi:hypothetical protein
MDGAWPQEFRITHSKGKSGVMDYAEIIKQLTQFDEDEADGRWEIEDIIDYHRWSKGERKGKN